MKKIALLTFMLLTLFACRKNIEQDLTSTISIEDPRITTIDYDPAVIEVVATLVGEVYDETGIAVANANVTLDGNNTSTDEKGRFVFKDITMNKLGTYVEVNKSGFFAGSNRFFPDGGSVNYVKITLLDKSNIGTFIASEGAFIANSDDISIDFPANSIIDNNGDLYQGIVEVAARWIDPTATNLQEIMPGGLQGLMPGGVQGIGNAMEEVALASFGMMAVELEANNGAALNLGNGKKATLSFPVPDELLSNASTEIPLWYFNETFGLWVVEGSATLQGNQYVGEVAHFSFWNCDAPFEITKVCGTILSPTGSPIANAGIKITILSSGTAGWGWTNSDGEFSGKVATNELLEMTVYENWYCTELLTETLGPIPFNPDTSVCENLGIFTSSNPTGEIDITATILDCASNPVTNGWVEIMLSGNVYNYYIDDGSNFSTTLINCNNQTELTALAGNIDDLMFSNETTYPITNPLDLGTITACDNLLPEWLTTTVDGVETTFPNVNLRYGSSDTLWLSGSIPGTSQNVSITLANGIGGPHSYINDDVRDSSIRTPSTSGGQLTYNCGYWWGSTCTYSQIDLQTFGNVGELVTGEISGTLEFFDTGTSSNVTKEIDIEFSILRD